MKNIIALTGPKGVGKTSLATLLSAEYGYELTSFARPIKIMLSSLLEYQGVDSNIIDRIIYGDLKEIPIPYLGDRSFRYAAQTLGTEWRDLMRLDLWTNMWRNHIASSTNDLFVVDDMRFLREAKAVRDLTNSISKIILIERNGYSANFIPSYIKYDTEEHISEREYLQITPDLTIENNASKYDMLEKLREWWI